MKRVFLPIFLVLIAVFSCQSDKDMALTTQEESISKYLDGEFKDSLIIRNAGVNRVVLERNAEADSLAIGDSLYFYYSAFVFNSGPSMLFDTNVEEVAKSFGFTLTNQNFSVKRVLFSEGSLLPGLMYGLVGVREREHCLIIFSSKFGFDNNTISIIPSMSPLMYEIWIDRVIKN